MESFHLMLSQLEELDPLELRSKLLYSEENRISNDKFDILSELRKLLSPWGLTPEDCGGDIRFDKLDPLMPSNLRLGGSSALSLVQQAVVACKIWQMRGGKGQDIRIDLGQAIRRLAPASELKWELCNGLPADSSDPLIYHLFRFFKTKDERHVLPINIYPGIKSRLLNALECSDNPQHIAEAISKQTADELEEMGEKGGFVMAKALTLQEFTNTNVFEYLASRPLIEIERIGDSPVELLPTAGTHPLSGIRALGMGHVIAGAGIGRSLAAYGADCLNIWRANDWELDSLMLTSNIGVRSTRLNIRSEVGKRKMYELLRESDIFYANRRPGLLEDLGVDLKTASKIRPGLIHVTVSTHGEGGPWEKRIGFDQVAGAVTGMAVCEGSLEDPKHPPTAIVNDYMTAWFAATGAMEALRRRALYGGSYRVHVSLTRVAMWILSLGVFDREYVKSLSTEGDHELIDPQLFTSITPVGLYQGVTEQIMLSGTPLHFTNVLSARGADQPAWLPKPVKVVGRTIKF
ncbi:hypothetical protein HK096_008413 [Nowakowskiella sp. JEL0078]|nr:hypothetical protein HK096_008413 [Nowakowskiella sp. JEL0078]